MCARLNLRTIYGLLAIAVLVASPAAAAPVGDMDRNGWFQTLETWWSGVLERLGSAFEDSGSAGAGGPTIDPGGASASDESENDGGPSIDPVG